MTKKQRFAVVFIWIIAIFSVAGSIYVTFINRGYTEVNFIDVGQGDSCLIQTENLSAILIDGGDSGCGKRILEPFLRLKSAGQLDAVFISHLHSDHIKGIEELIYDGYSIKHIYVSEQTKNSEKYADFEKFLNDHNIAYTFMKDDDKVVIDDVSFTAISSSRNFRNDNDLSLVLRFDCGTNSILFTGDISSSVETDIISDPDLDTDILKVPHHGSSTSSNINFIKAVSPEVSVISVGENNKYKHPSKKTVENYNFLDIPIIRTDYYGTITFIMTDNDIRRIDFSRKKE